MAIDLSVLDEEDRVESISPQGVGIDLSILDEEPSPSSDDTISPIDLSVLDEDTSEPDLSIEPFPEQKDRRLRMFDEGIEFVQDVDNIAGDLGNQISRGLTNIAGMPIDALGAVINKAASVFFPTREEMSAARQGRRYGLKEDTTIGRFNEFMRDATQEYLPSEGAAKKIRDSLNLIPGVNIVEEDPRTIAGYVGQVGSEFIAGLAPQVRAMQMMRASKPASYTGKALKEVSEQFLNELNTNAGRVLAIEASAAVPAGLARGALEDTDLPVSVKMLAEVVSGLLGGTVMHQALGIPNSLVQKTANKSVREINDMITSGEITYAEMTWTPTLRKEAQQVVSTADDQPIFYRGLAREQDLREGIGPGGEKRNPSFTESPSVAKFYSQKRKGPLEEGGVEFTPESTIIGSQLNIKNPLDMTTPGQQTTLREFVEMLDYGSGTGIGDGEVLTLVNYLKRTNAKAKGSFKFQLSDEFDSLDDYIKALGKKGVNEVGDELLVDTFALVDAPATGRIAKRLGYDGITHLDVLDGAADDLVKISGKNLDELEDENVFKSLTRFEPSDQELLAQRIGAYDPEELVHTTVRPLTKEQISPVSTEKPEVGIDPVMRSEIEGVPDPKNAQQTQVGNTIETVVRAGGILDNLAEGKTLDFGAGKGKGAGAIKADTYEPFAKAPFTPNYAKSTDIPNESYEKIISSSVINVVPRDIRDDIVREIGRVLKPNGYAIITARDPKTVASPKGAVPFAGESDAYIIKSKGRADTYQKGFTNQELQGYIKKVLGDDFDVKLTPKGLDGKKISGSSVIIQKKPGSAPIPKPVPRMPGIVEDSMKLQIARNQNAEALKTQAMANAVEIFYDFETGRVAPRKSPKRLLDKVVKVLAPSKVVGRSIVNDIEMARGTVARAEELAARVQRGYNRLVKKDPSVANDLNDFLLKGGRMSKSLEPIEQELLQYRGTILQLQKQLLEGLDAEEFLNLSKGAQNQLKEIIEASMEMGYLTQTYRMFLDPDFRPTKAQKDAAIAEIASKKLAAGETDIPEEATRMATEYIDDIVRSSAYQRKADGKKQLDISNVVKESKGILASRTDPGPAERIFLGEVTDPGERLISTASRLSRLASAKAEDVAIAKFLIDSGVATRNQVDPTQVEVKFRTTDADSNVWVSPDVNYAVNILRFNDGLTGSREIVNNFLLRLYSGATGFSKQTKVLFNPESYSVNGYGALLGTFSAGIVPTPTGIARGVNRALGDFGGLDNILMRKDPVARKRFLDDLDKMNQYGLKPKSVSIADLERNILDGFGKLNKLSKISKPKEFFLKISDFFGKLYSTSDTALRYVVWKGNQDNLSKMFPNASKAQIEAAAARLTNDTFPNYNKLSGLVRTFSRFGLAGQFVPFAAELTRNFYNQGKYAMKMMAGTFGRDIGLDPASAQKTYMGLQGVKRGGLLVAVTVGGDALTDSQNALRGVDNEDSKEFSETIAAPWDSKKKLLIIPDETGRKGRYINPEYLVPQAIFKQAFDAGFSDKPIESLYDIAYDQYIGELGTFPVRTALRLVFGRDEKGEPIYIDERFSENFKVGLGLAYDELLKPGGQRSYERFMDTAAGIGQRTQVNNALRLAGFRDNTWDADIAFRGKVSEINEPMRKAKQNYYGMLRRVENNYESPDKLEAEYQRNNEARKSKMDALRVHYENMAGGTLKYSVGERIELMREAGMSSSDILDIVEGTYTDIPRTRSKSIGDQYEELEGNPSQKLDQIRSITKEDRNLGGKLADYHKRQMKLARSPGRSELDKLRSSLPEERRVQYMIDQGAHLNRAKLKELREAGIATPSAIRAMLLQTK